MVLCPGCLNKKKMTNETLQIVTDLQTKILAVRNEIADLKHVLHFGWGELVVQTYSQDGSTLEISRRVNFDWKPIVEQKIAELQDDLLALETEFSNL